jgi:hypothetical protein
MKEMGRGGKRREEEKDRWSRLGSEDQSVGPLPASAPSRLLISVSEQHSLCTLHFLFFICVHAFRTDRVTYVNCIFDATIIFSVFSDCIRSCRLHFQRLSHARAC